MSARALLACVVLFGCEADADVLVEVPGDAPVAFVELSVIAGGCDGVPIGDPVEVRFGARPEISELSRGRYGFRVRARSDDCRWFAEGCAEQRLPTKGDIAVRLQPVPDVRPECCDGCAQGRCGATPGVERTLDEIEAGADFTLVREGTRVYGWGDNASAQLLLDPSEAPETAVLLGTDDSVDRPVRRVATGRAHACAIGAGAEATIRCWGDDAVGQVDGEPTPAPWSTLRVPPTPSGFDDATDRLVTGDTFSCVARSRRPSACWGESLSAPEGLEPEVGGDGFACAVAGELTRCWGGGKPDGADGSPAGRLAAGGRTLCVATGPELRCASREGPLVGLRAVNERAFVAVSARDDRACAIDDAGDVFCFGDDEHAAAGDALARVPLPGPATAIAVGAGHSCAIVAAPPRVLCWGSDARGQLAGPGNAHQPSPVEICLPAPPAGMGGDPPPDADAAGGVGDAGPP